MFEEYNTKILPKLELNINLLWSLPNASIESSECLNLGTMHQNTKINLRIQSHFSAKDRQTLEFWEASCLYWIYLKTYFKVNQKPKANLLSDWMFVNWSRMPNLVNEYKTSFIGNRHKSWVLWKPWKVSILSEPYIRFLSDWILKQGSKIPNLLKQYRKINLGTFQKIFFLISDSLIIFFWSLPIG